MREGCTVVTTPLAPRATGAGSAAASRSALTIRPPGPEPVTPRRSICDSRAIRRASGDAFTRSDPLPVSGALPAAAGAGATSVGCAGAGDADRASDASPIVAPDPGRGSDASPIVAITPPSAHRLPLAGDDPQRPVGVRVACDRRLVGLDLGDRLARRDDVAVALQPTNDRALLHRVRQPRHHDLGHVSSPRFPRARARRRRCASAPGMNASSSVGLYGIGSSVGGEQPGVVDVVQPVLGDLPEQARRPAAGARPLLDRQQPVGPGHRLEHRVEIDRSERAQVDRPRPPRRLRPTARRPRARPARPSRRTRSSRRCPGRAIRARARGGAPRRRRAPVP